MGRAYRVLLVVWAVAPVAVGGEPAQYSRRTPVVEAYEKVRDSVVNVSATRIIEVRQSPFGFHSMFDEVFDFPARRYARTSVGSGFVIHRHGYVVTNAHVVAKAAELKAVFADGRELDAQIVAMDPEHDLAVLSVDPPTPLASLKLGQSDDLMIGETVIAVGNPLGYQNTVTVGVVSALDRVLHFSNDVAYRGLIQTDASINPGNSGGPLLNINGELIGVNTAIRGDAQNIGFAIPVDQLRKLLPDMLALERLKRAWLGMRVTGGNHARVTRLDDGGPAQEGGLHVGDRIMAVDESDTPRDIDVYLELLAKEPGDRVEFSVLRNGKHRKAVVHIAEIPKPDGARLAREKLGLVLSTMPREIARQLGWKSGVVIVDVVRDGPAYRASIERGDILLRIGRYVATNLDVTGQLLETVKTGDLVPVSVLRAEHGRLLELGGTLRAQ